MTIKDDANVITGMLLIKADRPDIIGKIISYNDDLDEFHILFRDSKGLDWVSNWSALLMFRNLGDSWDVIKSSPVVDMFYEVA